MAKNAFRLRICTFVEDQRRSCLVAQCAQAFGKSGRRRKSRLHLDLSVFRMARRSLYRGMQSIVIRPVQMDKSGQQGPKPLTIFSDPAAAFRRKTMERLKVMIFCRQLAFVVPVFARHLAPVQVPSRIGNRNVSAKVRRQPSASFLLLRNPVECSTHWPSLAAIRAKRPQRVMAMPSASPRCLAPIFRNVVPSWLDLSPCCQP